MDPAERNPTESDDGAPQPSKDTDPTIVLSDLVAKISNIKTPEDIRHAWEM